MARQTAHDMSREEALEALDLMMRIEAYRHRFCGDSAAKFALEYLQNRTLKGMTEDEALALLRARAKREGCKVGVDALVDSYSAPDLTALRRLAGDLGLRIGGEAS